MSQDTGRDQSELLTLCDPFIDDPKEWHEKPQYLIEYFHSSIYEPVQIFFDIPKYVWG